MSLATVTSAPLRASERTAASDLRSSAVCSVSSRIFTRAMARSIHHFRVLVAFEFNQVVGWIFQKKCQMLILFPFKTYKWFFKERQICRLGLVGNEAEFWQRSLVPQPSSQSPASHPHLPDRRSQPSRYIRLQTGFGNR